jgi:cysteinyl-tRNA synthetase, unknown class
MRLRFLMLPLLLATRSAFGGEPVPTKPMPLTQVRTWMYQLENIESHAAVDALAKSPYDLLVIEPTVTVKGNVDVDIRGIVAKLHAARPGRLVIAYLDPCQAESFRTYWTDAWKPPTKTSRGTPDFLLIPDPDGWSED